MDKLSSLSNVSPIEPITEREREILTLLAEQRTNKEIATSLHLALSTVKWYTRQVFNKLAVTNRREAVERATALGILDSAAQPSIPNNLPAPPTPFVGRKEELEEIIRRISGDEARLVTLHGPGGSGKTRLAIQAASMLMESEKSKFSNGVWFISLAPLQDFDSILQAIASATGYPFFDREREPLRQLLDYLRQRHLLLILDNFEHLISAESTNLVTQIISQAANVKILLTSRTRLNSQGEQLIPVTGMNTPKGERTLEKDWNEYSAIQFFNQCARRIQPSFEISEENSESILRICQLVEGMPLGIEMAAAWLGLLTPGEIVMEIEQGFDFLQAEGKEDRHQSLRMVFNASWKLLSSEEQDVLMALTVFQGNFTREAAQKVSSTSLKILLSLVNKSWLANETNGRYHIHELLRQFAHEKLRADVSAWERARSAHASYYAALTQKLGEQMKGYQQVEAFTLMELEFENIRTTWYWLTEQGQFDILIEQMLLPLTLYCEARWRIRDPLLLIQHAQEKLAHNLNTQDAVTYKAIFTLAELIFYTEFFNFRQIADYELLWGKALPADKVTFTWKVLCQKSPKNINGYWLILSAEFFAWQDQPQLSIQRLLELKNHFEEIHDFWLAGIASQSLASVRNWFEASNPQIDANDRPKKRKEVLTLLQEALDDFRAAGDYWKQGHTLRMLASLEPNPENELSLLQQARVLLERVGDITTATLILHALAGLSKREGKHTEGFAYFHEEQKIFESLGNQSLLANALSWESIEALRYGSIPHARQMREVYLAILGKELEIEYAQGSRHNETLENMYAWGLWELGEIERVEGNFEKARQNYEEANQCFERQGIVVGKAFYYRGLGELAYAQSDYKSAQIHFKTSIDMSRQVLHSWLEVCALCGLGRAQIGSKQLENARKNFIQALRNARQLKNLELYMIVLTGLASFSVVDRNYEQAIEISNFVLHHFASWNETKQQAVLEEASHQLPADVVETAKKQGKNAVLEDILNRYLETQ